MKDLAGLCRAPWLPQHLLEHTCLPSTSRRSNQSASGKCGPRLGFPRLAILLSCQKLMTGDLNQSASQVVTKDAELGNKNCPENVRNAFSVLFHLGKEKAGRDELREHLHLCSTPRDAAEVSGVAYWIQVRW